MADAMDGLDAILVRAGGLPTWDATTPPVITLAMLRQLADDLRCRGIGSRAVATLDRLKVRRLSDLPADLYVTVWQDWQAQLSGPKSGT